MAAPIDSSDERSLAELTAAAKATLSRLLEQEKELARHELSIEGRKIGLGTALLAVAGGIGYFAFVLLVVAGSFALADAAGSAKAVGFMAVGLFFAFVAGNAAAAGALGLIRLRGPRRTLRTLADTLRWLRHPTEVPDPELEVLRASHRA